MLVVSMTSALQAQLDCSSAMVALDVKPGTALSAATVDPVLFALDPIDVGLSFGYPSGGFRFSHVKGPDADGQIEIVVTGTFLGPSAVDSFDATVHLPLLRAGSFNLAVVLDELSSGRSECLEQTIEVVDSSLAPEPPTNPCSAVSLTLPDVVLASRSNELRVQGVWPGFEPARWTVVGPRVDNRLVLELLGPAAATQATTDDVLTVNELAEGRHVIDVRQVVSAPSGPAQVVTCTLGTFDVERLPEETSALTVEPIVTPLPGESVLDVTFRIAGPWNRCTPFPALVTRRDERVILDLVELPGCAAPERQIDLRLPSVRLSPGEYVVQLRRRPEFFAAPIDLPRFPITIQGVGWAKARLEVPELATSGESMTLRLDAVIPRDCDPLGWAGTLTGGSIQLAASTPTDCDLTSPGFVLSTRFGPYASSGAQRVALQLDLGSSLKTLFAGNLVPLPPQPASCGRDVVCVAGDDGRSRFIARAWFDDGSGRTLAAPAAAGADAGGVFTFFDPDNPELFLKVLDGCGVNGRWWVFLSALTDVSFDIEVEDTLLGRRWTHSHSGGGLAQPVSDIRAFLCR